MPEATAETDASDDLRREIVRLKAANETYKTVALGCLYLLGKVPDLVKEPDIVERTVQFTELAVEIDALARQLRPPSVKA